MSDADVSPAGSEPTTYNLLFICTGNTCRSPMAEAIASRDVGDRGWSHVSVSSAGISAGTGAPASANAVRVAREHGLSLDLHGSRPLTPELIRWADLILVMGPSHLLAVAELGGGEKAALLTDFLEGEGLGESIEDPFGGDDDAYRRAFDQISRSVDGLLSRLEPILSP